MTKHELAVKVAAECGCTQVKTAQIIQKALDYMTEELAAGRSIELRNFGVFEVKVFKPKIGRNPAKPKDPVTIPERAVVKFHSGKILKKQVEDLLK